MNKKLSYVETQERLNQLIKQKLNKSRLEFLRNSNEFDNLLKHLKKFDVNGFNKEFLISEICKNDLEKSDLNRLNRYLKKSKVLKMTYDKIAVRFLNRKYVIV